ncbi:MAG: hypothetical protein WCA35_17720, partial [Kovacikia sp.]
MKFMQCTVRTMVALGTATVVGNLFGAWSPEWSDQGQIGTWNKPVAVATSLVKVPKMGRTYLNTLSSSVVQQFSNPQMVSQLSGKVDLALL